MRHGEDRGERAVRRVRLAVEANFAEEHRLRADDLAVDDDGLTDFCRLRHGQIAGVDQVFGLEIDLELIGNAERVPRRGQRVKGLKENKQSDARRSAHLRVSIRRRLHAAPGSLGVKGPAQPGLAHQLLDLRH